MTTPLSRPAPPKAAAKPAVKPAAEPRGRAYRLLVAALVAVSISAIAGLAWTGRSYYPLPLAKRVRSPLHDTLKPGGTLGRRLGILGSALMLANLAYFARRRVKLLQKIGTQRLWLEVHVFCGLTGPAILVFHSAFLANNLVARVTAASTALVVAAGIAGRYLYAQLPRNIYGKEMTLAEVRAQQRALLERVVALLPAGPAPEAILGRFAVPEPPGKRGAPRLILASLRADAVRLARSFAVARALRREGVDRRAAREVARATRRVATLGLRITQLAAFQRILSRWRGVHLKLTIVMLACMVVHVAVVTILGYGLL